MKTVYVPGGDGASLLSPSIRRQPMLLEASSKPAKKYAKRIPKQQEQGNRNHRNHILTIAACTSAYDNNHVYLKGANGNNNDSTDNCDTNNGSDAKAGDLMTKLGPPLWRVMHIKSFIYPDHPSESDMVEARKYFEIAVPLALECDTCRVHYARMLESLDVSCKYNLSRWVVDAHNSVNQRLGKQTVEYEQARLWYEPVQSTCTVEEPKDASVDAYPAPDHTALHQISFDHSSGNTSGAVDSATATATIVHAITEERQHPPYRLNTTSNLGNNPRSRTGFYYESGSQVPTTTCKEQGVSCWWKVLLAIVIIAVGSALLMWWWLCKAKTTHTNAALVYPAPLALPICAQQPAVSAVQPPTLAPLPPLATAAASDVPVHENTSGVSAGKVNPVALPKVDLGAKCSITPSWGGLDAIIMAKDLPLLAPEGAQQVPSLKEAVNQVALALASL